MQQIFHVFQHFCGGLEQSTCITGKLQVTFPGSVLKEGVQVSYSFNTALTNTTFRKIELSN